MKHHANACLICILCKRLRKHYFMQTFYGDKAVFNQNVFVFFVLTCSKYHHAAAEK